MSVGRNDPCPCGSGKKYKACCLPKDQARARMEAAVGAEVFRAAEAEWQALAREATAWEAEVAPVAVRFGEDRETAPALAMVMAAGYVVHGDVLPRRPAGAAERARVIASALAAAAGELGAWPERVRVRDEALAAILAEELAPRGVAVEAGAMPELDEALDASLEHLCENPSLARISVPARWAETEASAEALADFHRAAAEFHDAAPWKEMEDGEPLVLTFPDGTAWGVSVMGAAEMEYGMAMYSDPADLMDLLDTDPAEIEDVEAMDRRMLEMRGYWVTMDLNPRAAISRPMLREVSAAGWPVASPDAYPLLMAGGRVPERRVTAEHVARATLALRAVTLVARDEDPEPATGVRAGWLIPPSLWVIPDTASPISAEGPGAEPERTLEGMAARERIEREETERLERFTAWLPKHPTRKEDLLNARAWTEFLVAQSVPAGAVTEFDLRVFLYHFYPREAAAPEVAARLLPQSLDQLFRFLSEREGIRYPFAHAVLTEVETLEEETGAPLEELLEEAREELYGDLFARSLLPDPDLTEEVEWPIGNESDEMLLLRFELQRRWLLWYDELVRGGTTDFEALEDALIARQREWEAAPNPAIGGRTPTEAVHAYVATHETPGEDEG